jgi:cytochrome P450
MQFVTSAAEEIVKIRREQGGDPNRKDLLQLMIDASDEESHDSLSTGEIITDSMTFMLAGYETSSNFLMFASYLLALNPEIQEKLFQSISLYMEENSGKSMYDACNEIEYLDMVANEVFRVYPPGYLIIRNCVEPCTVEGMRFEKGNTIFVPVYNLHRDEEIWPEPEKFDPDRFLPSVAEKRHPCSHLPFGFGPRNCVGMRLAILESKMALMEVISKYRIVVSPETEVPLELKVAITLTVKEGLFLKFESRSISEE